MSYIGTRYRLKCSFFDFDGLLADPDVVTVTINGAVNTPVRDSTGVYHFDYVPTIAGDYIARWLGTGALCAAAKTNFSVLSNDE